LVNFFPAICESDGSFIGARHGQAKPITVFKASDMIGRDWCA